MSASVAGELTLFASRREKKRGRGVELRKWIYIYRYTRDNKRRNNGGEDGFRSVRSNNRKTLRQRPNLLLHFFDFLLLLLLESSHCAEPSLALRCVRKTPTFPACHSPRTLEFSLFDFETLSSPPPPILLHFSRFSYVPAAPVANPT